MLNQVLDESSKYSNTHNFSYEKLIYKKGELWGNDNEAEHNQWAKFEKSPGVYILATGKEIIYIGKSSTGSNVGQRLFEHFNNKEKLKFLTDDSDVAVLVFSDKDKSLTLALESYLIEKFKPKLNKIIP